MINYMCVAHRSACVECAEDASRCFKRASCTYNCILDIDYQESCSYNTTMMYYMCVAHRGAWVECAEDASRCFKRASCTYNGIDMDIKRVVHTMQQ